MDERKTGVCEYCNEYKTIYKIKEYNYISGPTTETIRHWCMDCYHTQSNALTSGKYKPNKPINV